MQPNRHSKTLPAGACLLATGRQGRVGRRRPGVALLEVLIALALFVVAAAVIGSALRSAMAAATDMRRENQAADLAQTVLAELNAGILKLEAVPATAFDEDDPEWTYEVAVEEIEDDPALKRVTVIVRNADALAAGPHRLTQWMLETGERTEEELAP